MNELTSTQSNARATSILDAIPSVDSARANFASAISSMSDDSQSLVDSIPTLAKASWLRRLAAGWRADATQELDAVPLAVPMTSWFVCGRASRQ